MVMTWENRDHINKLCECIVDLIIELQHHDGRLNERLEWIRNEVESIREDTK